MDHDPQHSSTLGGLCLQVGAGWVAASCPVLDQLPYPIFPPSVDNNEDFVAAVSAMAEKTKCPLTVCPLLENRQDRWIQVGAG